MVFPSLHEVVTVNMNTLCLHCKLSGKEAVITKDCFSVDLVLDIYLHVEATEESILRAARTLGSRTESAESLGELLDAKLVDSVRSVAAEMAVDYLHERRGDYVQKLKQVLGEGLSDNGLKVESVSLKHFSFTAAEHLDPDDAFNARGLTKISEEVEAQRRQRFSIEQDTQLAVQQKTLDVERKKLDLFKQEEYARLEHERDIAVKQAEQQAQIASERARRRLEAREAEISAEREEDLSRIRSSKAVEEAQIEKDFEVRELEISKESAQSEAKLRASEALARTKEAARALLGIESGYNPDGVVLEDIEIPPVAEVEKREEARG